MRFTKVSSVALIIIALAIASSVQGFTPASHRNPPLLKNDEPLTIPRPVRIIAFVRSDDPNAQFLKTYPKAVANSTWLTKLRSAYAIPAGTVTDGYIVSDMPLLTSNSKSSMYQNWVQQKMIQLGIPSVPDHQTIIVLFIPCTAPQNLDGFGCISHHPPITGNPPVYPFTQGDSLAVSLRPSGTKGDKAASHEFSEALTDTHSGNGRWHLQSAYPSEIYKDSSPWVAADGGTNVESADEAHDSIWYEEYIAPGIDYVYTYTRVISNSAISQSGDPTVPRNSSPYYNVSTTRDWYSLPRGTIAAVHFTGWSTAVVSNWTVKADIPNWSGFKTGSSSPCAIVSITSWIVNNARNFTIKVKTTSAAQVDNWCAVRFESSGIGNDVYHPWWIGFQIK